MAKRKTEFSGIEAKIFDVLQRRKTATISQIVERVYSSGDKPAHAREVIRSSIPRMVGKLRAQRAPFDLYKTERCGPYESEYSLEKRA